ncbi:MAG: MFS transporter [Steroidobacteraceae bacterium]
MTTMTARLRDAIESGAMSSVQVFAVALCTGLNMLDGFDVLVMAFTAAEVAKEWSLSGAQLGVLLSAGLFGMAGGSLFLAPLADRFGRRALIVTCLVLITIGMLLSAATTAPIQLAFLRALTGLGIGGMLASLSVITGEFASGKWRSASISAQVTGYSIGATIGGIIAGWLMANYGWRSVFAFGGVVSGVLIPVVLVALPESLDYLLARRPPNALSKLNSLLRKMGRPELEQLPPASEATSPTAQKGMKSLFTGQIGRSTLLIWTSFFMLMLSFYFFQSWTPRLLVAAGMSNQQGVTGGVLLNIGGIIGGAAFAWTSVKVGLKSLSSACMLLTAVASAVYAAFATGLVPAFTIALFIGMFMFGAMASLYSITPLLYPPEIRATGTGWAIGIGRIGAIVAPLAAGVLIDSGWQALNLYYVFAIPVVVAMVTVRALPVK